jgi:hypothetical protein
MKTQTNHWKLGATVLTLLFIFAACQGNFKDSNNEIPPAPPAMLHLIVYGKLHNIAPPQKLNPNQKYLSEGIAVLFMPHRYPCSDSTSSNDAIRTHLNAQGIITISRTYSMNLTYPLMNLTNKAWKEGNPCFTASVITIDTTKKHPIYNGYYRILAGPKKLGAAFDSHLHRKRPYDSVRVDFTLPDSSKYIK